MSGEHDVLVRQLAPAQRERLEHAGQAEHVVGVTLAIEAVDVRHVDLERGIVVSCNAYFAQLAQSLGPKALLDAVVKAKPSTAKGKYVKKVNLAATMSPGVLLDEAAYAK